MSNAETYVKIVGEPFLSRAKEYRERLHAWRIAWSDYAKSKGATGYSSSLTYLTFASGGQPDGWTKPNDKGFSRPKKGHPDGDEIGRMRFEHPKPLSRDVYGDTVCCDLSYEAPNGSKGSYGIGDFGIIINGPWVGWAGDTYFGLIPDAEAAVREFATQSPDRVVLEPAASWKLPDGLIRISKAEFELIIAQHRVAEEKDKAA